MSRQEAYEIVINDICQCNVGLLVGCYDAKHGNEDFMHGISTVIEYLAIQVSTEKYEQVSEMFLKNMIESKKRV